MGQTESNYWVDSECSNKDTLQCDDTCDDESDDKCVGMNDKYNIYFNGAQRLEEWPHPRDSSHPKDSAHPRDSSQLRDLTHPKDSAQLRDSSNLKDESQLRDLAQPNDESQPKDSAHTSDNQECIEQISVPLLPSADPDSVIALTFPSNEIVPMPINVHYDYHPWTHGEPNIKVVDGGNRLYEGKLVNWDKDWIELNSDRYRRIRNYKLLSLDKPREESKVDVYLCDWEEGQLQVSYLVRKCSWKCLYTK